MEDYKTTQQYKAAKRLNFFLTVSIYARIICAVAIVASLFCFIWLDFILAFKILQTCLLSGFIVYVYYLKIKRHLAKLYGSK